MIIFSNGLFGGTTLIYQPFTSFDPSLQPSEWSKAGLIGMLLADVE